MINFIIGRSGYGKSTAVLEGIKKDIADGKRIYLIVPEQQAVVWETRAAKELGPKAFLSLDIVGFSRLANLVCRRYGNLSYNYIGKGEKALVVWSAMLAVRDGLKKYACTEGSEDRSVGIMTEAISELKRHGVTASDLEKAITTLDLSDPASSSLADRLSDLGLVLSAYTSIIKDRFDDADDELSKLNKTLSVRDFFSGSTVYIDSYYSLTPDQHGIVESIFRQADDVTVTLACDPTSDAPQFRHTERMYKSLVSCASKIGKEYKKTVLTDDRRRTDPMLRYLETNLFSPSAKIYGGEYTDAVTYLVSSNRYEEADAVAATVCRMVHNGAKYGEIAVIAYDVDRYAGIIDRAFDAEHIPYHLLSRSRLASEPASRLIFSALALVSRGWQREDVISLAKTGLFGITADESDALEKYVTTWRLRGIHSYDHAWSMNPNGYTDAETERGNAVLALANSAREKMFPPLETFADATAGGVVSVVSLCKACYDLTVSLGVYDSLEADAVSAELSGQTDEAVRLRQIYPAIVDALDTVALTLPDAKADIPRFARLFRKVVDETDIGTIPASSDEVILGSAAMVRTDNVKHVILLGTVEGEFPGVPTDAGFFSDTDKMMLEESGIVLSDKTELAAAAEQFAFYRAVAAASESLTVSVPQSDGKNGTNPSEGAIAVRTMFDKLKPKHYYSFTPSELVWNRDSMAKLAAKIDTKYPGFAADAAEFAELYVDKDKLMTAAGASLTERIASLVTGKEIRLSKTELEKYVGCPFSYLCDYVLRLDGEKEAKIHAVDVGNIIHRILEQYYKTVTTLGRPLEDGESEALADRLIAEYMQSAVGGKTKPRLNYLFGRLRRSVMMFIRAIDDEFENSSFSPIGFEVPIKSGVDGALTPISFDVGDGVKATVNGKIDRIDVYRDGDTTYVRVVDYKTGKDAFSLNRVRNGFDMQLLIYLFTIWKGADSAVRSSLADGRKIEPAGAMYFNVGLKDLSTEKPIEESEAVEMAIEELKRSGIFTNNEDILRKMDGELSGKYIPVKLKTDGTFAAKSCVASNEDFDKLYAEIGDSIKAIAGEMKSGKYGAKPYIDKDKNACEYCRNKAICRKAEVTEDGEDDG